MGKIVRAAVLAVLWGACAGAEVEVRTANFRVVTKLEPAVARAAAEHLERVRHFYAGLGLGVAQVRQPLPVMLLEGLDELTPFIAGSTYPINARGLSVKGSERSFILVAWNPPGSAQAALAHEYAHQLEAEGPPWFREGMAEYLSWVERAGQNLALGKPVRAHMASLRTNDWIRLSELVEATHDSAVLARKGFYAQSWLLFHWLVEHTGGLNNARPQTIAAYAAENGWAALENRIRLHLDELVPRLVPLPDPGSPAVLELRPMERWELPFLRVDVHREQQQKEMAESLLRQLRGEFPRRPEPHDLSGAIQMDAGRYGAAEGELAAALRKGSRRAETHHRYALLLLRPAAHPGRERSLLAAKHARLAWEIDTSQPNYAMTLAQALMVAEDWDGAARELSGLAREPGWHARAVAEFTEVERRRQQQLLGIQRPAVALTRVSLPLGQPDLPAVSPPPVAPPPKPESEAWPPPGTVLIYGRISSVECHGNGKFVTVQTPRYQVRLRELPSARAKLHYPPLKWKQIPCGTRGWEVNAAYRPVRGLRGAQGDLVALVF